MTEPLGSLPPGDQAQDSGSPSRLERPPGAQDGPDASALIEHAFDITSWPRWARRVFLLILPLSGPLWVALVILTALVVLGFFLLAQGGFDAIEWAKDRGRSITKLWSTP